MRPSRFAVLGALTTLTLLVATVAPSPAQATSGQATDSLTIRDILDLRTASVADLSGDGRWLAMTVSVRRDDLGQDFSRDGDPTYLRVMPAELLVVDTKSLAQRPVFRSKTATRVVTWSHDGSRLAMLVLVNEAWQVQVWDRASGRITIAPLPVGQYVAENSELRWTGDGRSVAFALRTNAWKERARQRFNELSNGPITALDASDDFLEWDDMNRMSQERSIVAWDVGATAVRTIQPEGRIGTWLLAKDGSAITIEQDITKETDYDVIRGREWQLVTRPMAAGDAILASNSEGYWLVDIQSGEKEMIVPLPDTASLAPRPTLATWSHDGRYLYFTENSRTEWDRAITRYDRQGKAKADLVRGGRFYRGLQLSDDGSTAVLTVAEGNRVPDVHVADASLSNLRRVMETNPQMAGESIPSTSLISYLDADGNQRYGVV